jgi:hypothetical protein
MNAIVSVLGILVFVLEGVLDLFAVVVELVIVQAITSKKSWRDKMSVCLTFIRDNNKKYLPHKC